MGDPGLDALIAAANRHAWTYNAALGNRIGRPTSGIDPSRFYNQTEIKSHAAAPGSFGLAQSNKRWKSQTGRGGGSGKSPLPEKEALDKIVSAASKFSEEKAKVAGYGDTPAEAPSTEHPKMGLVGKLISLAARPLDIASRPLYAVGAALTDAEKQFQSDTHGNSLANIVGGPVGLMAGGAVSHESKNPLNFLGALGKAAAAGVEGAVHGIEGKEKKGYGDFIEEASHGNSIYAPLDTRGQKTTSASENAGTAGKLFGQVVGGDNPATALKQWTKRGLGMGGDIAMMEALPTVKPTSAVNDLFGKGTKTVEEGIKASKIDQKAINASRNAIRNAGAKEVSEETVKAGVNQLERNPYLGKMNISPETQRIAEGVQATLRQERGPLAHARIWTADEIGTVANTQANQASETLRTVVERIANKQPSGVGGRIHNLARDIVDASHNAAREAEAAAKAAGKNASEVLAAGDAAFTDNVAKELARARSRSYEMWRDALETSNKKRFGLRVVGKDMVREDSKLAKAAESAYKPFAKTGQIWRGSRIGSEFRHAFVFNSHFGGATDEIRHAAESFGVKSFEEFKRDVYDNLVKNFTKEERKEIARAVENGHSLANRVGKSGVSLQDGVDYFKTARKAMWDAETTEGVRANSGVANDKYLKHIYKNPLKKHEYVKFAKERTQALKGDPKYDLAKYTMEEAKKRGFRPSEDAAELLLGHKANSNRKIIEQMYLNRLVESYGIRSTEGIDPSVINKLQLQDVTGKLNPNVKSKLAPGEKLYLEKGMHDTWDSLRKIHNGFWNSDEHKVMSAISDSLDFLNRQFKFSKTVINPGYHLRNFTSDAWMAWLDGISPMKLAREDAKIMKVFAPVGEHGMTGKRALDTYFTVGGKKMHYEELWKQYMEHASSSGFMKIDMPNTKNKVLDTLRTFSERREDTGRFAHYLIATDQETSARLAKGMPWDKAFNEGELAARARVNKFNIDYTALTPKERHIISNKIIPFYTFNRKAIPLMIENMVYSPARLGMTGKGLDEIQKFLGVEPNTAWDRITKPDWLKDAGYLSLNNDREPTVLSLQSLPTSNFADLFGGGSTQSIAGNFASQLSPGLRIPLEQAAGKHFYNDSKIKKPLPQTIWDEFNPAKGGLYGNMAKAQSGSNPTGLQWLSGMGIDVRKINENQQLAQLHKEEDPIQVQISKINSDLQDKEITVATANTKSGKEYRVRSTTEKNPDGSYVVYYRTDDPGKAYAAAKTMLSAKKKSG